MDGKTECLKKRRLVPRRWISEAWVSINEEYARLTSDSGYDELMNLSKSISRNSCRLIIINSCLNVLKKQYSQKSVDLLHQIGYKYQFNPNDGKGYARDIERVNKQAKIILLTIEKDQNRYAMLTSHKKTSDHWPAFNKSLITLSKYMGYHLDPDKLTVSQYVEISNHYKLEVERTIKQKDGYRKNRQHI